jgi:hypothetical protein
MRIKSYGKRPTVASWRGLAAAAAVLVNLGSAAHATTYAESSYGGDFSNNNAAPTVLSTSPFALGSNIVSGETGNGDNDYFTFTIAKGQELTSLTVLDGATPPDRIFIGIATGASVPAISTFMSGGNFVTSAGLLGWSLFNADQDGENILPALGASAPANFPSIPGATGFTGPLGAGTYSMWVLDGDGPAGTPYSLDYNVSGVPEPSTWALMLAGVGLAGWALRRRARQGFAAG